MPPRATRCRRAAETRTARASSRCRCTTSRSHALRRFANLLQRFPPARVCCPPPDPHQVRSHA
eukprot:5824208-Prymnesium_polylepis.1